MKLSFSALLCCAPLGVYLQGAGGVERPPASLAPWGGRRGPMTDASNDRHGFMDFTTMVKKQPQ